MIKNNRSQHALALAATLTAFCTIDLAENNTHAASADSPKTIFIIMDGIPTDVVESVPTPNLDDISSKGGFAPSFVGGEIGGPSESPTVSAVGYQSLLTGTWANKHNVWDNDVDEPNYAYWDIFRIAKAHDSTLSTAVFSTWTDNRTKLIGNGLTDAGGEKLDYYFDGLELDTDRFPHDFLGNYIGDIDTEVVKDAARYVRKNGPDLAWVYLEYTDGVAHVFGDSEVQHATIQTMDAQVGDIWSSVQYRQETFDEDWLIIVTTDHGRDANYGRNHGGQSARERATWIVTNSDRLNERFQNTPAIVDILPSIAQHMNLSMPAPIQIQLDGQSFID
jgi:predicted AlkP superfamily pyrophosphatase or phosphodiesterase